MTNNNSAFTFFSMIKKGNLLRADRPLEPDNNPPFIPWGSNLIPHYLSSYTEPQMSNSSNLVCSQNLSAVKKSNESTSTGNNEISSSRLAISEEVKLAPSQSSVLDEPSPAEFSKPLGEIDMELLSEVTNFNNSY